jgi:hypothetical protein
MLIDRIPDHPEEFEYAGRFHRYVVEAINGSILGQTELGMTAADAKALADAWAEHTVKINAPKLTEEIITAIMAPPVEEDESKKWWGSAVQNGTLLGGQTSGGYLGMGSQQMRIDSNGNLGLGAVSSSMQNVAHQTISYREHMAQQQAQASALMNAHYKLNKDTPAPGILAQAKKVLGL